MKKTYITPRTRSIRLGMETPLCGSNLNTEGGSTSGNVKDDEFNGEFDVKGQRVSLWDDQW